MKSKIYLFFFIEKNHLFRFKILKSRVIDINGEDEVTLHLTVKIIIKKTITIFQQLHSCHVFYFGKRETSFRGFRTFAKS